MEREITIELKNPEIIVLVVILTLFFWVELQVAWKSPIVFGDEGFHVRIAQEIAKYTDYPMWLRFRSTNVSEIGFVRPPMWNMLMAGFFFIFGFGEAVPKILTPFIASVLIGVATYVLVKRLYGKMTALFSSIIAISIPSLVTYSVLFYTDSLFVLYFTLFTLTFIVANVENKKKYWLLSGVFGAFSFLTKTPGYLTLFFIGLVFLYRLSLLFKKAERGKAFISLFKRYVTFAVPFLIIVCSFFVRSYAKYNVIDCNMPVLNLDKSDCDINEYEEKIEDTRERLGGGTEENPIRMGIINYSTFAYGNLWFVPFSFLCGAYILAKKRNRKNVLLLLSVLVCGIFLAYNISIPTARAEDINRYLLGWVPIIAIISGIFFGKIYEFIRSSHKYLPLAVIVIAIVLSYISITAKVGGMVTVKSFSPAFFEACDWAKDNLSEEDLLMTVWVHHTAYNCQTRVTGTVIDIALNTDPDEMVNVAKEFGITHIFIQKFSITQEPTRERYHLDFVNILEDNPDKFVKVFENGPDVQQCVQAGGCDGSIIYEVKY